MLRNELVKDVSQRTGINKNDVDSVLDALAESITDTLVKGDKVVIRKFMNLEVTERKEHRGRHPLTGEVITYPPSKIIRVKISKQIKDAVNGITKTNETVNETEKGEE